MCFASALSKWSISVDASNGCGSWRSASLAADGHPRQKPLIGAQLLSIASIHAVFRARSLVALSLDKDIRPVGWIGAKLAIGLHGEEEQIRQRMMQRTAALRKVVGLHDV